MTWKNERLECYGVLRTVIASFELHSYLLSQLPMADDYRDRLIYLSCHKFLTFHVFKSRFSEIMPQLLRFTCESRRAF